jgi:2'-5' RNA ligase
MNAIVSLLDDERDQTVRNLWTELEGDFGVTPQYVHPFTHFSFHVADDYDVDELRPALEHLLKEHGPFTVSTGGLGIFTGQRPVLFVPVVRNPELDALHSAIWSRCTAEFGVSLPYYAPDSWIPHITLAQGPSAADHFPDVVRAMTRREFAWRLIVDNLAVIEDGGEDRGLRLSVKVE